MAKKDTNIPADAASTADAAQPKGKKTFLLIIVLAVMLAGAGGGWLAFSQYGRLTAVVGAIQGAEEEEGEAEPVEYGEFMEMDGMVINPDQTDGKRYLMVSVALEGSAKTLTELDTRKVVLRDIVLNFFGEKTIAQLGDISYRTTMKEELREKINTVLQKGEVERLYFTQYVLQ